MKASVKVGFLALVVSFFTSCTDPKQPQDDGKIVVIDSLNKAKAELPEDSAKASIEEVDTTKESVKGN